MREAEKGETIGGGEREKKENEKRGFRKEIEAEEKQLGRKVLKLWYGFRRKGYEEEKEPNLREKDNLRKGPGNA